MIELKFAIYHRAAEVCPHRLLLVDVVIALGIWTLAALAEESLTQESVEAPSQLCCYKK